MTLEECTDERFDHVLAVNLGAAFRCARAAVPSMRTRGGGVIVNIGSVAAFAAQRNAVAYAASKAGLLGLTRASGVRPRRRRHPRGVRRAGRHRHPDRRRRRPTRPGAASPWTRSTPLGRRGQPADVAGLVSYLCSPDAAFVTGTSVTIDGGWLSY